MSSWEEDYASFCKRTDKHYKDRLMAILALGLCAEAGEVAGELNKAQRGKSFSAFSIAHELGDVLWFLTRMADECGYTLRDLAELNAGKLKRRATAQPRETDPEP